MLVAGVDGCPDGWIAAVLDTERRAVTFQGFHTFGELLLELQEAAAIGVDIPIGLMFTGERQADKLARVRLPGKASSVFSAPHPAIRLERNFANANEISKVLIGKGISQQALAIFPKIAEVNDRLTPAEQSRVFEVHPEVSFAAVNGGLPVRSKKGEEAGYYERLALLEQEAGFAHLPGRKAASKVVPGMKVNADDTLDAIIAAWSAERFATGTAGQIPIEPETGFRGLAAQISY